MMLSRHCEERSEEAIQKKDTGLLPRFAPCNNGVINIPYHEIFP